MKIKSQPIPPGYELPKNNKPKRKKSINGLMSIFLIIALLFFYLVITTSQSESLVISEEIEALAQKIDQLEATLKPEREKISSLEIELNNDLTKIDQYLEEYKRTSNYSTWEEYNALINKYNQKVEVYNTLKNEFEEPYNEYKSLIEEYNKLLKEFRSL